MQAFLGGYGKPHPCSWGAKLFTCIYALFAVPLALVALANLGDLLIQSLHSIWILIHDGKKKKNSQQHETPMLLALFVTIVWMFGSAAYFCYLSTHTDSIFVPHNDWKYLEAIYFVFISVTTIGNYIKQIFFHSID